MPGCHVVGPWVGGREIRHGRGGEESIEGRNLKELKKKNKKRKRKRSKRKNQSPFFILCLGKGGE